MNSQFGFVVKVVLLSGTVAAAIKYLAPLLPLPATPASALAMVAGPPLLLALILLWQSQRSPAGD